MTYKLLGLGKAYSFIVENLIDVKGIFSLHFQNIFSPHTLMHHVVGAKNYCYDIIPYNVYIGDRDKLDSDFSMEELIATLSSMHNGKSPGLDGLPCEFRKAKWKIVGDIFCCLVVKVLSISDLTKSLNHGLIKFILKMIPWIPFVVGRLLLCIMLLIKSWLMQ